MAGRARALAALVPALAFVGCGGDGGGNLDQAEVRECLAGEDLGIEATVSDPILSGVSPDFTALAGDVGVDVVVEPNEERAQRTAANLRGVMSTLGVTDVEDRILEERNVIAIFSEGPAPELRDGVTGCLE